MPPSFDSTNSPRSQGKVSTLKLFLESCLTLAKDHDALEEIASILYQQEGGWKYRPLNWLHKNKMGREMRMNAQIGEYDVYSIILDLG